MDNGAPGRPSAFRAVSGWIPLALSAAAIALLAGYFLTGPHAPTLIVDRGVVREDEGAAAHVWQLLMAAQLPVIAVFAARWLPRDGKRAAAMLAIQALAIAAAAAPVYLMEHGYLG
ncbi:MAG: hypothetical protein ABIO26_09060 [Croceibacterium sp.]